MRVKTAHNALQKFAREAGVDIDRITAAQAVSLMLDFYKAEPADGVHAEDGDMLLYQWGVYRSFPASASRFRFDLTRQFIVGDGEDDDIWQLSLTLQYEPGDLLAAVPRGDRWCPSRAGVDEMRLFISQSAAFSAVAALEPIEVTLHFEAVG